MPASVDWAEVYASTYSDLVRFLYRRVWDAERARDLAQDAFVRALRREPPPERPRSWLFAVAVNLARDEARAALRGRRHLALARAEEEHRHADPESGDSLERQERIGAVRRALERLSQRDREVLLLWDAGMSYEEIAVQAGLSPGAVGTTLSRARRRLVDSYRAWEDHDAPHR